MLQRWAVQMLVILTGVNHNIGTNKKRHPFVDLGEPQVSLLGRPALTVSGSVGLQ
jgi:hypothetical protein